MTTREEALRYHSEGRRGKLEIRSTKPTRTQHDLSLAYSPGVAEPCREIHKNPDLSFEYTARANLVAVITNGTAVLGLGNIGAVASKPVMEGKAVLFKRFADIDVFDLEVDETDPEKFIQVVKTLGAGFGGINLEDIRAPDCYEIETRLRDEMDIPVFHDDQHGTAIIGGAALLNALEITGKKIENVRIVINGAGAAALASARLFCELGATQQNMIVVDSKGVIHRERTVGMNPYKEEWRSDTEARTLEEALAGADVFVGLSKGGVVSQDMVRSMAADPIVFALANPDPEISYPDAKAARDDVIVGTGRSDYPNQINNVLGFPFLFRGALDVRATTINEAMKLAAVTALARLAKAEVPDSVSEAYGHEAFRFGREYLIPKPLDPRALVEVSSMVAEAAMESGVARAPVDMAEYRQRLENLLGRSSKIVVSAVQRARRSRRARIVFPEGDHAVIVHAAHRVISEGVGVPILLGKKTSIEARLSALGMEWRSDQYEIVDPASDPRGDPFADTLYALRKYKGMARESAVRLSRDPVYFGTLMVHADQAECCLSGIGHSYAESLRPALQIIRVQDWLKQCCGLYVLSFGDRVFYLADTTVNIDPDPEQMAEIAICAAEAAERFGSQPRVAMLSFSNFGSSAHPRAEKVRQAVEIARARYPGLDIVGELQADAAVDSFVRRQVAPGSTDDSYANVLIFPDLDSANIAYKLLIALGRAEAIGPIILGLRKPVNIIPQGATAEDVFNLAAITVLKVGNPTEAESTL